MSLTGDRINATKASRTTPPMDTASYSSDCKAHPHRMSAMADKSARPRVDPGFVWRIPYNLKNFDLTGIPPRGVAPARVGGCAFAPRFPASRRTGNCWTRGGKPRATSRIILKYVFHIVS